MTFGMEIVAIIIGVVIADILMILFKVQILGVSP